MRIALFIDQANMWSTYKTAGKKVDLPKLLSFIEETYQGKIVIKNIYLAYPEEGTRDYSVDGIHKFTTYLHKWLWFFVRKKPLKRIVLKDAQWNIIFDKKGTPVCQEKWNLDVELAIDVVQHNKEFDVMVLLSGDSDFLPLVNFLRARWKKSYIISSEGHISMELRTGADGYTNLLSIDSVWWEKLRYRNEKP